MWRQGAEVGRVLHLLKIPIDSIPLSTPKIMNTISTPKIMNTRTATPQNNEFKKEFIFLKKN